MYYGDLGESYPPQPPLFDLHNSSDHTQPGPIIAEYLILLFQLVLDGNRDNKKRLIPTQFFVPFFKLFIYLFYISQQLQPLAFGRRNTCIFHFDDNRKMLVFSV